MEREPVSCLLGVDGGGTKTVTVITDMEGKVLGRGEAGPANMAVLPEDEVVTALAGAIASALKSSGKSAEDIAAAGLGLAGYSPNRNTDLAYRIMNRAFSGVGAGFKPAPTDIPYVINHDAAIALVAGTGEDFGMVVIAGTGSIAYGKNREGQEGRAGGWGPLLGDDGSAYDIALRAIRASIYGQDGRGEPTALREALLRHLNFHDLWQFVPLIHAQGFGRTEIAALAPLVASVARTGDRVARQIFLEAGESLSTLALAVIRKLRLQEERFSLAAIGGVFQAGDLFLDRFRSLIQSEAPLARIGPPLYEPAVGAALMARTKTAAWLSR